MNPVCNTACYCSGVRMDDARRQWPPCNDIEAAHVLRDYPLHHLEYEQAKSWRPTGKTP